MEPKSDIYTTSVKSMDEVSKFFNNNSSKYIVIWYEKRTYDWNAEKLKWDCYQRIIGKLYENGRK